MRGWSGTCMLPWQYLGQYWLGRQEREKKDNFFKIKSYLVKVFFATDITKQILLKYKKVEKI